MKTDKLIEELRLFNHFEAAKLLETHVIIDWETAEYFAVFVGQVAYGNAARRRHAVENLAQGMSSRKMETAIDIWNDPFVWYPPPTFLCSKCKAGKRPSTSNIPLELIVQAVICIVTFVIVTATALSW